MKYNVYNGKGVLILDNVSYEYLVVLLGVGNNRNELTYEVMK